MLKGAAGTGKTTLVSEFLKILSSGKWFSELMAPTGRAAYIIGNKTGHGGSTIHRSIYSLNKIQSTSQNKEEEDDGGLHLRYGLKVNNDAHNTVYIVDESSMISDVYSENEAFYFGSGYLLTDLFDFACGRKIVFIGDYAQLPPIGMRFSPALDKEYIENKFSCRVKEVVLTEVMRQSNNGVMLTNATKLRDSIERKVFNEFRLSSGIDSDVEKVDLLTPYFQLSPSKPHVKSVVITYSNKQALEYNQGIRRHYYGQSAQRLISGELLMVCRNNYAHDYELFNGNIIRVESCQPDYEVDERHVRVKLGKNRVEVVTLRFRKATVGFLVNGKAVSMNITLLDNFLDDTSSSVGGLLARALIVDFNNRLPHNIKSRLGEIRKLLRNKAKLTDEEQELCDAYAKLLYNDPYYNAIICKYGYAMTCHKAQGGEWDYVFVDMNRYGGTSNEDYFRWAYTALTRASKKVWHYNSPDFDYISRLVVEEIKPSAKIKVSVYTDHNDFLASRFQRIKRRTSELGLSAIEDKSKQYQHLITIKDANSNTATYQLWYNAHGYSGKEYLVSSSSDELTSISVTIIDDSFAPAEVPFSAPDRAFAERLVAFIRSQLDELGIQLLNITQEAYQDVFHLKTDGLAQIGLMYNEKGSYTYMRLISSLGLSDNKLNQLRNRFI